MSTVTMHNIEMHNFLSIGNDPMMIELDRAPTTLISGPNGSGKSTVIDAITFVLFGKTYRGINKQNVVNSVNQKKALVKLTFSKAGDLYVIERGVKPTVFNIYHNGTKLHHDGSSVDFQQRLESILGFSYKAFCQTCMIGSSDYVPFMRLTAQARRQMIEQLLDIGVFSDMSKALKHQVNEWREERRQVSEQYRLKKAEYDNELKWMQSHNDDVETRQRAKEGEIDSLLDRRKDIESQLKDINNQINEQWIDSPADKLSQLREQQRQLESHIGKHNANVKHAKEQIVFFQSNQNCPTCEQLITEDVSNNAISKYAQTGKSAGNQVKTLREQRQQVSDSIDAIEAQITQLRSLESSKTHLKQTLESIDEQIDTKESEFNRITESQIDDTHLNQLAGEIQSLSNREQELADQYHVYAHAQTMLKDGGIKASIIRQYLPILNAKVNEYLQTLNFPVKFELDEEFNESLMSRFRNEFTYANFSMGERQRMDMSLLFAWRDVAKMKNSVNTNVLFLDETLDSSVDEDGTNALLSIIEHVAETHNIFIVSHKSQLEDKLTEHIQVGKINGFSKILD